MGSTREGNGEDRAVQITKRRTRRPRKQPLLALGDRRIGREHSRAGTSQSLLEASGMSESAKVQLYEKLREDFVDFLQTADQTWEEGEECRRYTIFGDCITCASWEGRCMVSGSDVIKVETALYRLAHLGQQPEDRRKFEEGVYSDLRSLRVGEHAMLEEANSPLLQYLYRLNSVRTHKRQKVFYWDAVPFLSLFKEAQRRETRGRRSPPSKTGGNATTPYEEMMGTGGLERGSSKAHVVMMRSPSSGTDEGSPKSWNSSTQVYSPEGGREAVAIAFLPSHSQRSSMACCSPGTFLVEGERRGEIRLPPLPNGPEKFSAIMRLAMVADAAFELESSRQGTDPLKLPSLNPNPSDGGTLPKLRLLLSEQL